MPVARSTKETFRYVLKSDREKPTADQAVFFLRALPTSKVLKLIELQGGDQLDTRNFREFALKAGLSGWENLKGMDGQLITFKADAGERSVCGVKVTDPVSDDSIDCLTLGEAVELLGAIVNANTVTAADAKN